MGNQLCQNKKKGVQYIVIVKYRKIKKTATEIPSLQKLRKDSIFKVHFDRFIL